DLSIVTSRFAIDSDHEDIPAGDCVIVCGPKSAPVAWRLLADDPFLSFDQSEQGWSIVDARTKRRHFSPFRSPSADHTDIGYFSRRVIDGRIVVHIAGITSIGSLGVARWLSTNLPTIYDPASRLTSGIVECDFTDDFTVTETRLLAGPYTTTEP